MTTPVRDASSIASVRRLVAAHVRQRVVADDRRLRDRAVHAAVDPRQPAGDLVDRAQHVVDARLKRDREVDEILLAAAEQHALRRPRAREQHERPAPGDHRDHGDHHAAIAIHPAVEALIERILGADGAAQPCRQSTCEAPPPTPTIARAEGASPVAESEAGEGLRTRLKITGYCLRVVLDPGLARDRLHVDLERRARRRRRRSCRCS